MATTRRSLAGAAGLLAVFGTAAPVPAHAAAAHHDAELIALGAALDAAVARQIAWERSNPHCTDEELDAVMQPCCDLVEQIEHMEAHTLKGLMVKARAISWCNSGSEIDENRFCPYPGAATDGRIAASIVRDLLRRS